MIYLYIVSTVIFIWVIYKMHRRITDLETEYNTLKAQTVKTIEEYNSDVISRIASIDKITRSQLKNINSRLNRIESTLHTANNRLPDTTPIEPDEIIEEPPKEEPNKPPKTTTEEIVGRMVITGVSKLLKSIL